MAEDIQATNEVLIASIDKGPAGRIHVRVSTFRDRDYIDIRNFYEGEGGEWLPTRKGIAVPIEFYTDLVAALATAKVEIDRRAKAQEASAA
ncbi:MAG: transcriptional coactivator p15/PC4 family protein [Candidatus Bipolaricaulota bacterium]